MSPNHNQEFKDNFCVICEKHFNSASQSVFFRHIESHLNEKRYWCGECHKEYKTCNELNKHKINHLPLHQRPPKMSFPCSLCNKTFHSKNGVYRHTMSHTTEKRFHCEDCDKRFKSRHGIYMHRRVFHQKIKPFKCSICSKLFSTNALLQNHTLFHTRERPIKCEICGNTFRTKDALRKHRRLHFPFAGKHKHVCTICEKDFPEKYKLDIHMRCHQKTNRSLCTLCGKSVANLSHHMNTHTREHVYKCRYCEISFLHQVYRSQHERSHTDEAFYKCRDCFRRFKFSSALSVHRKLHKSGMGLTCLFYDELYESYNLLDRHVLRHTNELW